MSHYHRSTSFANRNRAAAKRRASRQLAIETLGWVAAFALILFVYVLTTAIF